MRHGETTTAVREQAKGVGGSLSACVSAAQDRGGRLGPGAGPPDGVGPSDVVSAGRGRRPEPRVASSGLCVEHGERGLFRERPMVLAVGTKLVRETSALLRGL